MHTGLTGSSPSEYESGIRGGTRIDDEAKTYGASKRAFALWKHGPS